MAYTETTNLYQNLSAFIIVT